MRILCDTNILLRAVSPDSDDHQLSLDCMVRLRTDGRTLVVVPQCLYEFYVVATRPAKQNGLGVAPDFAMALINSLLEIVPVLRDERAIFEQWVKLVTNFKVSGKTAHDTRLVAAMKRHGVSRLLTFNNRDFARYDGIEVLTPKTIVNNS